MRVLIVEDDPTVRRLMEVTLRDVGQVTAVASHTAATSALATGPDVVVLDLGLPHLRWDLLGDSVAAVDRVVVVTAHIEPGVIARAEELGAAAVLTKPFRPAALRAAVQSSG